MGLLIQNPAYDFATDITRLPVALRLPGKLGQHRNIDLSRRLHNTFQAECAARLNVASRYRQR
jgi:hypothetical protein